MDDSSKSDWLTDPEREIVLTKAREGWMVTFLRDDVIGGAIRTNGHFEEAHVGAAIRFIEQERKEQLCRSTFVDIGANIGTHTLWAINHGFDRAICIEADANNFRVLRANQVLNGIDHRCENILAAASNVAGSLMLELAPTNYGDHRVRFRGASERLTDLYNERQRQTEQVASRTLDEMLSAHFDHISIVWCDTQGHEGQVLAGGGALLSTNIPLVLEFWPYGLERANGYSMLRSSLGERPSKRIFDLRSFRELTLVQLDSWYEQMLEGGSEHSDILVI